MNPAPDDLALEARTEALFAARQSQLYIRTDRLFEKLLLIQWLGAIVLALIVSPSTWSGSVSVIHPHVWAAIFLGGILTSLPVALAHWRPGEWYTRHVIAAGQLLMSALLIHVSGGRIETHFHIFGSLAFLAFYRDRNVLLTAATVITIDHLIRGAFWPLSVYGILAPSPFRWMEHAFWVAFECTFLFVAIAQSLHEQRAMSRRQAKLERTVKEVEETQRQLIHADRLGTIGRLAAGIAHEVNNPVGYTISSLNYLVEELSRPGPIERPLLDELLVAARDALEGSQRVRRIVKDLKGLAHVDEHRHEALDLHEILESAMKIAGKEIQAHAQLRKKLEPVPQVYGDSGRLGQVFLNLLVNAAQSCSEDSAVNEVEVSCWTDSQGRAVVDIRDTGSGIPPEVLARLFTPFFTTKPVGVGTGLGLSISRKIVADIGGEITVESTVKKGTTFHVILPPMASEASAAVAPAQLAKSAA